VMQEFTATMHGLPLIRKVFLLAEYCARAGVSVYLRHTLLSISSLHSCCVVSNNPNSTHIPAVWAMCHAHLLGCPPRPSYVRADSGGRVCRVPDGCPVSCLCWAAGSGIPGYGPSPAVATCAGEARSWPRCTPQHCGGAGQTVVDYTLSAVVAAAWACFKEGG
jgi:hypothetical protein